LIDTRGIEDCALSAPDEWRVGAAERSALAAVLVERHRQMLEDLT
jgi:hypothetical protein